MLTPKQPVKLCTMVRYRLYNNILGWLVFLGAAVVYLSTIEPTASFWDCGEFIAASYKLEVGHPPGAPLFLLMGRLFSLFASDPTRVAAMINSMSALASAFTILFMFWTITHIARRILIKEEEIGIGKMIAVFGAGLVGAFAYTFSDTFWFSAVEGEVYASSSLFTAAVFWAILKWEEQADDPASKRWIVLIAYLMGLSIGVHLLNLLAIPAIVMVYYFRKYTPTTWGVVSALLISMLILGLIEWGLIPGVVKIASWFELFFINVAGMPYHFGVLIYILLIIALVSWLLYISHTRKKVLLNTIVLCFTVFLIGYSSYTMIIVRSSANPPMDQNNPDNVFDLLKYLNREQYQSIPLISGPYYNAPVIDVKEGKATYSRRNGKYVITDRDPVYKYDPRFVTLFPRMYSNAEDQHIQDYIRWGKVKGTRITVSDSRNSNDVRIKPTFSENLRFFFRYQLGYMYLRYFMWNFAGRQNDIQGNGSVLDGNWISGIPAIDNPRLGPQENLPQKYKDNAARNCYYLLPLLLGIIGLVVIYRKDQPSFWVTTLFFVFTGIAVVVYLNQYPHQPRERDYAYAASFYVFSIWIGLGMLALYFFFKKYFTEIGGALASSVLCLLVPVLMATENWDDHDRSGRYTARDFAYNYLNTCADQAILFTNGDNDTFPLWYIQEVEGVRTDVRVVNLSYLGASWYISQMKRKAYESEPVPFSLKEDQYVQGTRDVILFNVRVDKYVDIQEVVDFITSDDPRVKVPSPFTRDETINYMPTRKLRIPVDSSVVLSNGTVSKENSRLLLKNVDWGISKDLLYKNDMMIIDLMATNHWKRPVYFAVTIPREIYLQLEPFFQAEGYGYRVVPIRTEPGNNELGRVDADILFNHMMKTFRWGNANNPKVYLDENNLRMISNTRNTFARLANVLVDEGKKDSAVQALDYCMKMFPDTKIPHNFFSLSMISAYYRAGESEKGDTLARKLAADYEEELRYLFALDRKFKERAEEEKQLAMYVMNQVAQITGKYGGQEIKEEMYRRFQDLIGLYNATGG